MREIIQKLKTRQDLTAGEMELAMTRIMSGKAATEDIVDFLTALSSKGETTNEIVAAAKVMRSFAVKVNTRHAVVLDTCGTGGDRKNTFNVSTAVAFIVSACGVVVAKHGNRSVSSSCGSADILEALGVNIHLSAQDAQRCLDDIGIAFLFAPDFHPAMKYAMAARKQIAKRTIFNIMGPLCNPAGATHQLIGVFDPSLTHILAQVLGDLGVKHALVVHGNDGLDEVTITDKTIVSEFHQGQVKDFVIDPQELGFSPSTIDGLIGSGVDNNAVIIKEIFAGRPGPKLDMAVINAAAALYTAEKVNSLNEGIESARRAITSGAAAKKLEELKRHTNQ